jgi:hypothetical protein
LPNKYVPHKNKGFLDFDVVSEFYQPKHIKIDVLKNLICTLIKEENIYFTVAFVLVRVLSAVVVIIFLL